MGTIWGNATRLQQVASNLLTNAVKFTPAGGEVKVVLERAEGRALLRVSDNGCGIDPAFLPRVFRRFSQENSSTTRVYGGLGLGLAIVHHLVQLHGGTIRAESAGPGRGSTFFVSLPLERTGREVVDEGGSPPTAASATRPEDPVDAGLPRRLVNLRVLVVDDDTATRQTLAEVLKSTGAEVSLAESAAEGLLAVERFRPGVVLCDIAMPGEDGYSFIRRMRALGHRRGGGVPAVALTALAGEEDCRRAISAGFQMHVPKPVDINRLTQVVADLSAHASLRLATTAPGSNG